MCPFSLLSKLTIILTSRVLLFSYIFKEGIFVNVVNCLCVKTIYTEFLKIFYFIIISLSSLSSLLILILFLSLIYNNTYFINNKYLEIPFYLTNSLTINIFQRFINFIKLDPTMSLWRWRHSNEATFSHRRKSNDPFPWN